MNVLIPYAVADPKSRLSPVLDDDERRDFSRIMLDDVRRTVAAAGGRPTIIATDHLDIEDLVIVDDRPLTEAVNAGLDDHEPPTAIVMADLPLLTADTITRFFETPGDVVLAPGRGGGTNAIIVRVAEFTVDYHRGSFLKHRDRVDGIDGDRHEFDSHRLATDIDEPADLVEVLIHGTGESPDWLRENGFSLEIDHSRLSIVRNG